MITDINLAMQKCFKNGIKVYPIKGFFIQVKLGNKIVKTFDKKLNTKEVNEAMTKTYIYYANKI